MVLTQAKGTTETETQLKLSFCFHGHCNAAEQPAQTFAEMNCLAEA